MTTSNTKVEDQKSRLEHLEENEKYAKDAGVSGKNLAERMAQAGAD
jgi:hypothetical protein